MTGNDGLLMVSREHPTLPWVKRALKGLKRDTSVNYAWANLRGKRRKTDNFVVSAGVMYEKIVDYEIELYIDCQPGRERSKWSADL